MEDVTRTILEQPNGGFGGLGSGFVGDDSTQNIIDICTALFAYKVLHNK